MSMDTSWPRYALLVCLGLVTSLYTLLRAYTKHSTTVSYKEILYISEVFKFIFTSIYILKNNGESSRSIALKFMLLIKSSWKILFVAVGSVTMNIFSYGAYKYIGAGEHIIVSQTKIITNAILFSILKRKVSGTRWRAVAVLVLAGVLFVSPYLDPEEVNMVKPAIGYFGIFLEAILSSIITVYLDTMYHSTTESISVIERNFQLSLYSALLLLGMIFKETAEDDRIIPWTGWTGMCFITSLVGAVNGLLVGFTLKYFDINTKRASHIIAVPVTVFLGCFKLQEKMTVSTIIGCLIVTIGICNFTASDEESDHDQGHAYSVDRTHHDEESIGLMEIKKSPI